MLRIKSIKILIAVALIILCNAPLLTYGDNSVSVKIDKIDNMPVIPIKCQYSNKDAATSFDKFFTVVCKGQFKNARKYVSNQAKLSNIDQWFNTISVQRRVKYFTICIIGENQDLFYVAVVFASLQHAPGYLKQKMSKINVGYTHKDNLIKHVVIHTEKGFYYFTGDENSPFKADGMDQLNLGDGLYVAVIHLIQEGGTWKVLPVGVPMLPIDKKP